MWHSLLCMSVIPSMVLIFYWPHWIMITHYGSNSPTKLWVVCSQTLCLLTWVPAHERHGLKCLPNAWVVECMTNVVVVSSFFPHDNCPRKPYSTGGSYGRLEQRGALRIILCYCNTFLHIRERRQRAEVWKDADLMLAKESCVLFGLNA